MLRKRESFGDLCNALLALEGITDQFPTTVMGKIQKYRMREIGRIGRIGRIGQIGYNQILVRLLQLGKIDHHEIIYG
jgi:hypothetical protein